MSSRGDVVSDTLVVVPAFNEEEALGPTLAALMAGWPDLDVLVVDDGSSDRTASVASAHGAVVVSLPYNLGIGGALRTGFRYAVRHDYRRAIQFDADGQHDPRSIPALLDALDDGVDLAIGNRFAVTDDYQVGKTRTGAIRLLRFLVHLLTGKHITDPSSGFRGFSATMLQFFAVHYPVEYMESVESLILADGAGFTVREAPVHMTQRAGGEASTKHLRLAYHFLRLLVVMSVSKGAMRRASLPGASSTRPVDVGQDISPPKAGTP
ncbi:MAG TPA: glycosyltransferase family 2 protein [Microthrixaceae bacterium]|nr:glycosyltransferase family 2 protein [Microthrixaceae bacterium]